MAEFIFSINSGRSGSNYLCNLLGTAKNSISFHEASPQMNKQYLKLVNNHSYNFSYKERMVKVNKIKSVKLSGKIYCETNHMFIKTFHDVAAESFGTSMNVIILRRYLPDILKSFIELSYFNKNPASFEWMTDPNANTAAIQCIDKTNKLNHFEKCIAYLIDIEGRAQRFKKDNPNIKTHDVRIEDLNNVTYVANLFKTLNLQKTNKTYNFVGTVINQRDARKQHFKNKVSISECEDKIYKYIDRAKKLGIDMPNELALDKV